MAVPNPDDSLLLIRCPSCGQRFKVGEDLRERTVECGGCENRFRINDEVIVRGRKVYPGERKIQQLTRFQRVPLPGGEKTIGVQPMRYTNQPDPAVMEPMSPQRIMAGAAGVVGMAIVALMLMFGSGNGGILDGMDMIARLMMAGFACVLGIFLLIYANPKARMKATLVGVLLGAGVMALPFFFKTGLPVVVSPSKVVRAVPEPDAPAAGLGNPGESAATKALREQIGTAPLELEIKRLAELKNDKHAVGMWMRGMTESNRYLVMDYIVRMTGADLSSHFYPRDNRDFLFVVTGITMSLQDLGELAAAFGKTEKIYPAISVVEVTVRNETFIEGPLEKLNDKSDPAFYELNKRELESIENDRVKRAVQRLSEAEPKIYRTDISRKLLALLDQPGIDFKTTICVALAVWADKPGVAGEASLKEVRKLLAEKKPVPVEMIGVIVKEKNPAVLPILDDLWSVKPLTWESLYGDMGPAAEATLIARYPGTQGTFRYSATRLLGRVGGAASLPLLESAEASADVELKVLLIQARKSIADRLGR